MMSQFNGLAVPFDKGALSSVVVDELLSKDDWPTIFGHVRTDCLDFEKYRFVSFRLDFRDSFGTSRSAGGIDCHLRNPSM